VSLFFSFEIFSISALKMPNDFKIGNLLTLHISEAFFISRDFVEKNVYPENDRYS
jgi:hypothetical protein